MVLESCRIGEVFPSRKNKVFRVEIGDRIIVVKEFPQDARSRLRRELEMLKRCHGAGIAVPEPISTHGDAVLMEYIEGPSLAESFDLIAAKDAKSERSTEESRVTIVDGLASWLASFHRSVGFEMYRGDSILKNFILSGDKVYGIDFEESGKGDPIQDVGQACSYILSSNPPFTDAKFGFVTDLTARYWEKVGRDRSADLPESIAQGLEHYAPFRSDRQRLLEWAHRMRMNGMPSHVKE